MYEYKSSSELKQLSRKHLMGKYQTVIPAYFLMQFLIFLIMNAASSMASPSMTGTILYYVISFIVLLFAGIFILGQNYLYLQICREDKCTVSDMWYGFSHMPDKAIITQFIMYALCLVCGIPFFFCAVSYYFARQTALLILSIVTLILFIICSTIIQLLFSQVLYLLIDFPEKTSKELITLSISLMKGHLGRLFYIKLSFLGMLLLVLLTIGIGSLWVAPYINMVSANFYEDLTKGLRQPSIDVTL